MEMVFSKNALNDLNTFSWLMKRAYKDFINVSFNDFKLYEETKG